jgi:transposase
MSTTAAHPATTPIPVQLSDSEFTAFILPHVSMPKRGPKCKLGYHRVLNLILWVLYTGMQWKCLPDGLMMGRCGRRLWRVYGIWRQSNTSTPAYSMATGPTPWLKKG